MPGRKRFDEFNRRDAYAITAALLGSAVMCITYLLTHPLSVIGDGLYEFED